MEKITGKAYAKINLFLDICGIKSDGYHLLKMVMQSIDLHDEILIKKIQKNEILVKNISDNNVNFDIKSEENIAYKVATKFFAAAKISDRGIEISIKKNIPVGAGLGGGSADGAAVLKMLNKMFETNFSIEQLAEIGVSVGADIPFCLYGATALVEGIGEKITPINRLPNCYIVVAKPAVSVNTANAFKAFDDSKTSCKVNALSLIDAIKNANLTSISHNLFNVFEQVIDIKEIENIKKIMHQYGALNQIMTGSGSAVFGIFDDEKFACNCAKMLKTYTDFSFLCNPIYEKNV